MDTFQLVIGGLISALLLYQGFILRQSARIVEKLERIVEDLRADVRDNGERLARLEAKIENGGMRRVG
jgi:hypothetical protein